MKILMATLCLFSSIASGNQLAKISIGMLSPNGTVGVGYENKFTEESLYSYYGFLGVAADATGGLKTVGARAFRLYAQGGKAWHERCWFVFEDCKSFYSLSGYLHHSDGGEVKIIDEKDSSEYSQSPGWMSSISIGTRDLISDHWLIELEISKRFLISGLNLEQKSGSSAPKERKMLEDFRASYGFSFAFGYMW